MRAPYYIRALLDAHTLPRPEISENVAEELERDGLIVRDYRNQWNTTDRGKAYVQFLLDVPLPGQQWIVIQDSIQFRAKVLENSRLCRNCRMPLGEHSHEFQFCQRPYMTGRFFSRARQFVEITCQAGEGSGERTERCGKNCIPGTEFCAQHTEETI